MQPLPAPVLRSALVLFLALAAACGGAPAERPQIVVYAAASTRDALQALEPACERALGVELVFNFGSSGTLARQILAAAQADLFLSADEREMDEVERAGLLLAGTRVALLSNQLVVIEPAGAPTSFREPFEPAQLAGEGIARLSLADPASVPAGRYARAWLEARGAWDAVAGRVLPGVDVRAALAAVAAGGAPAGIVYRTDAARSSDVRVVHTIPLAEGPRIAYPLAAIAGRPAEREARAALDFLASPDARAAFEAEGFLFLPALAGGG